MQSLVLLAAWLIRRSVSVSNCSCATSPSLIPLCSHMQPCILPSVCNLPVAHPSCLSSWKEVSMRRCLGLVWTHGPPRYEACQDDHIENPQNRSNKFELCRTFVLCSRSDHRRFAERDAGEDLRKTGGIKMLQGSFNARAVTALVRCTDGVCMPLCRKSGDFSSNLVVI